jgi:hypothetical protein
VLETNAQIQLRIEEERTHFHNVFNRTFQHIKILDDHFLTNAGLDSDIDNAFSYLGWGDFASTRDPGSRFLTMEFLCTLKMETTKKDVKFTFWFFNHEYTLNLEELSTALGFETRKAITDLAKLSRFSQDDFWEEFSGLSPIEIHRWHRSTT